MEARKALAQQQKELFKAQARMTELDTLFRKLYEDNALGRLTDERFEMCIRDRSYHLLVPKNQLVRAMH